MNKVKKKNKRLCETLKVLNKLKVQGQDAFLFEKARNLKVKKEPKKCAQNTFSMIQFYKSIPKYDEIRHLPEYDFSRRVDMLKEVHYDLSKTLIAGSDICKRPVSLSSHKRKTNAKKKKNDHANNLCDSFRKASLVETNDIGDDERIDSTNPFVMSTPQPTQTPSSISRTQDFHKNFLPRVDDDDDDCNYECKHPTPKMISSPVFLHSPHLHKYHDIHRTCDIDSYHPHDHSHHTLLLNDVIHYDRSDSRNMYCSKEDPLLGVKSPTSNDILSSSSSLNTKVRRAKSCPKELFSVSSRCSDFVRIPNGLNELGYSPKLSKREFEMNYVNESDISPMISRQQNFCSKNRSTDSKSKFKTKSKTPNSMDDFIASKFVRSNLAATLRQRNSRKKINDLAEEKLKETMDVSKFIPKCHFWNVRHSPAWKTFISDEVVTPQKKRMREEARREEQKLRKHIHAMNMNIMRARVKSAQLLLEGRSLPK